MFLVMKRWDEMTSFEQKNYDEARAFGTLLEWFPETIQI